MTPEEIIKKLTEDSSFGKIYNDAISSLLRAGLIEYLKIKSQVIAAKLDAPNFLEQQTALAFQAMGYQQCLDDLLHFQEKYIHPPKAVNTVPPMDFGGITSLVENGELTEQEADGVRREFSTLIK